MLRSNNLMPVLSAQSDKTGIFLYRKAFFTILVLLATVCTAGNTAVSGSMIERVNGKLSIKVRNLALKDVAALLHQDFALEIKGLEELGNKKITFDHEAISLEELIRGLLRHLNIKNYAFEFAEEKLRTVTLLPGAKTAGATSVDATADSMRRLETIAVAVIQSVIESSQAQALDLRPGDVIVQYDGIRIRNAAQLVKEVKEKSNHGHIEMVVVRNDNSRRSVLQGGFIGVRITTEQVSEQAYRNYF